MKLGNWVYTATFVLVFVTPGTESTALRSSLRARTRDFFNAAQPKIAESEDARFLQARLLWDGTVGMATGQRSMRNK